MELAAWFRDTRVGQPQWSASVIDETVLVRFADKVLIGSKHECWEWIGAKRSKGYGAIKVCRRLVLTHRLSYEIFHGKIPHGMVVMHSCDNSSCCNPFHLSVGTQSENMKDAVSKGRVPIFKSPPWNSMFTRSDVEAMIEMRSSGCTYSQIAKSFSTSKSVVRGWVTGKRSVTLDAVVASSEGQKPAGIQIGEGTRL